MDKVAFVVFGFFFVIALGGTPAAYSQGSLGDQVVAHSGQPSTSVAAQVETCRQHVVQLAEQSRTQQTQLTKLRAERKTIGVSGGEMARFKLTNLDQEIRDLVKQNQSVNAQAESETKRCDNIGAKPVPSNRTTNSPAQPSGNRSSSQSSGRR